MSDLTSEETPAKASLGASAESAEMALPKLAPELPAAGGGVLRKLTIDELLREALDRQASDLHLTNGVPPILRIDGSLRVTDYPPLTPEHLQRLVYSMLTEHQISEFETDWELDCSTEIQGIGRFRVNVHRQRGNIEAAFRVVSDVIKPLADLGLPRVVEDLCRRNSGLMLITGPTGSGKTTTMAAMIHQINRERRCMIITIEDPIEYIHLPYKSVIKQREVNFDTQSFQAALRHALRQDPDVICIGEMRDLETISTALTAAETGHMVMATIHTPDATQTIDRVIDVFPPHQQEQVRVQLAGTLIAIMAQQLLPIPGQTGRVAAVELLISNNAVRKVIRSSKHEQLMSIMQTSSEMGMISMDKSLKNLYQQGLISYEDAKNRARFPESFDQI
jgi:twitching motility protein PilT